MARPGAIDGIRGVGKSGPYDAMRPYMADGRYVNYLGDDESGDSVASAYGPNYARLREIKKMYDPGNLFQLNQNIRPA